MSWTVAQTGEILQLAESGLLSSAQLDRAAGIAPLKPERETWLQMSQRLCAFTGVVLLASGIICFFAYNWADLHRFVKMGMAWGLLAACVTVALFKTPHELGWRAALLGASICTGALLALIGQTYQTGADMWELFANWAVLMLPFALLARSSATWTLWLLITNIALIRYFFQEGWLFGLSLLFDPHPLLTVAVLNILVLLGMELFDSRLLHIRRRLVHRLAASVALTALAAGASFGWWTYPEYLSIQISFFVTVTVMGWFYLRVLTDIPILALLCLSLITVFTAGLVELFWKTSEAFVALNIIALFVIAASGGAAAWLTRLYKASREHTRDKTDERQMR